MKASPTRRPSRALRILLGLAILCGIVSAVMKHRATLFPSRIIVVASPVTVTPGHPFFIEVTLRNRVDGRPLTKGRAALIKMTPTRRAHGENRKEQEWVPIDSKGRARIPAVFDPQAEYGRGMYLVKVDDGFGGDAETIPGIFDYKRVHRTAAPSPLRIITDKPAYQPGETIRYAVLTTDSGMAKPLPRERVTVVVEDGKGNEVERRDSLSSGYGIVSGTLPLSTDPNLGAWRITAGTQSHFREKTVTVANRIRRRLDVQAVIDPPYVATTRETLLMFTIRRFDGAPAAGVRCVVKLSIPGVLRVPLSLTFNSDDNGFIRIPIRLMPLMAGGPGTPVIIEAMFFDGGTPETWRREVPFFHNPLRTAILPENGSVELGAENRFILAAWRPDGKPAPGEYHVRRRIGKRRRGGENGVQVVVGESGWASFSYPSPAEPFILAVTAKNREAGSFHFAQTNGLRILPSPAQWEAGGKLEGEVRFAGPRSDGGKAELAMSCPGGPALDVPLAVVEPGRWRFSADIPTRAHGELHLQATIRESDLVLHRREMSLPVSYPKRKIAIVPSRERVAPREEVGLVLHMGDQDGAQAGPAGPAAGAAGAATVVVSEASLSARSEPEALADETGNVPDSRLLSTDLPPPVLAAFDAGALPFFVFPGDEGSIDDLDNADQLLRRERRQYGIWRAAFIAAFLALLAGWVIALAIEAQMRSGKAGLLGLSCLEIAVVAVVICIIAIVAAPNAVRVEQEQKPEMLVSGEERERAASRAAYGDPHPNTVSRYAAGEWFPETIAFFPEVVFDGEGRAEVSVTADAVGAWRVRAAGISAEDGLVAGTGNFTVEKPLSIEPDFPAAFFLGDRPELQAVIVSRVEAVAIHVAIAESDAFSCEDANVEIGASPRSVARFRPHFLKAGETAVRLTAVAIDADGRETARDEIVVPVSVAALNREVVVHDAGALLDGGEASATLSLPAGLARTRRELRVFPTPLSRCLGGVEALLRMPAGCFEQTVSINASNLILLDSLKQSPDSDPLRTGQTIAHIRRGYQRALTFEEPGGGFSRYGRGDPDPWLSAFGLLYFQELEKVVPVDPKVAERTSAYLEGLVPSGSQKGYVAWALAACGRTLSPALLKNIERDLESKNRYEKLTASIACLTRLPEHAKARKAAETEMLRLLEEQPASILPLPSAAKGRGMETELLALAILAGQKAGLPIPDPLYESLANRRSPDGGWPGTHATYLALKALAGDAGRGKCAGVLHVSSEGKEPERFTINGTSGVFPLPDAGDGSFALRYEGEGRLEYLIAARGETSQDRQEEQLPRSGLNVRAALDRAQAAVGDEIVLDIEITERGDGAINPVIELGPGAGMEINYVGLDALIDFSASGVERYERRETGVALHLRDMKAGDRLRIRLPLISARAGTYSLPPIRLWECCRPENAAAVPGPVIAIVP